MGANYTELLDLVKGSNETLEQINKQLETLSDPASVLNVAPVPAVVAGVEDQAGAPQSYFQRQLLARKARSELAQVLRTKSTPEIHMLLGMRLAMRDKAISFEEWAMGSGMASAIYDGFHTQASGAFDASLVPQVQNAIDTGGAAALIRQDLEPFLYELYVREFTAFERFTREPANGLTHTFNQITAFGGAAFMPELGTVTDSQNVYERKTTNVAIIATRRGLSLKSQYAVAAGGMSYNPMDLELQGGLRAIAKTMQYQIFSGQSSNSGGSSGTEDGAYDANAFDGLRKILNTTRAKNVNPLVGTAQDIKQVGFDYGISEISQAGGPNPSIIWMHPNDKITFDQQQDPKVRLVQDYVDIGVGARAARINVLTGEVPLAIVKGDSIGAYTADVGGLNVRDAYLLDEQTISLPFLGSEGPTVLDIPIGISGQLTHLFIIFGMWGLAVKALPFSNKIRIRQS